MNEQKRSAVIARFEQAQRAEWERVEPLLRMAKRSKPLYAPSVIAARVARTLRGAK